MRLLFLTSRLPYPPDRGDRLRTYHLLKHLGREHEITLVSFVNSREEAQMGVKLDAFCREVHLIVRPMARSVSTAISNIWRRQPLQLLYYRSRKMQKLVDRLLAKEKFEAVYVHLFRMAPYVINHRQLYRIVDLTDVISSEIGASLPYRAWASRVLYSHEQMRIAEYERRVVGWAEEAWLISERDKLKLAESCPQANLHRIPNGVDLTRFFPTEHKKPAHNMLFVGHMGVFRNIDAVMYLVYEILPKVRREIPDIQLNIVGAGTSPQIRGLEKHAGVTVLGYVSDLIGQLNQSTVFVAPIRFSAGIQNKVLEAMAAGVAVVTTSNVNEGISAHPGQEILVGDNTKELADCIVRILSDEPFRSRLRLAGRAFVEKRFSWQAAVERMRQIEEGLAQADITRRGP